MLDTRNFTKSPVPSFPYAKALETVLPGWDMSLVFAGETRSQSLNIRLRGKDYVPNVLSYEIGEKSGEIVICLAVAKKQAPEYGMTYTQFVGFLFIHGCLHLKGERHGATMESKERLLLKRFTNTSPTPTPNVPKNRNRN
ncbi:rRNA maturation RNase YbeY [Patescibacteria group bacterium]|nr:rRNA maturation RNase YbeY [Patescibacteria group bacterium]MBU2158795.1 rRNA maturation RNase YbeY [Patescibacteria group bacterium]